MARIIPILLSSLIFFQSFNVSVNDITKLKTMIEHLDYHQEHFDESVGDFVAIHYGSEHILHSDDHEHNDEHENLPFKNDPHSSQNIPIVFIINSSTIEINNNDLLELTVNFFYKEMHSTFEKPNIFQPPKHS